MKLCSHLFHLILPATFTGVLSLSAIAATPEQESAFVASYKKALTAGDSKTLAALLDSKGVEPELLEMFKMMQTIDKGSTIESIELLPLDQEDIVKMAEVITMPNGKPYKLGLKPYKKLVIKTASKEKDITTSGSSTTPIAEKDGKLVIPMPVAVK
jgi:hypothetical protein